MSTDPPIACSLNATELPERVAEMKDLGDAALLEIDRAGTRAELRFAAGAAVRERLEEIVGKEARCCPFLNMRLSETAGVITLHVQAPEGAELVLSEITEAFGDRTTARARCVRHPSEALTPSSPAWTRGGTWLGSISPWRSRR